MAQSDLGQAGCPDWWRAETKDFPSVTSETVKSWDWLTKSVLCKRYRPKSRFPTRPHYFYIVSKTRLSFYFVLLFGYSTMFMGCDNHKSTSSIDRNMSTPWLLPERPVWFCELDRNAVMKLCPTFLCILTWESPWRERVCKCVVCFYNTRIFL